jgi:putative membrane protein
MKGRIMGIRFLTPAAVACLLLNTTVALAPAAAQTAKQHVALASDSNFIQTAMSIGLLQVKLGKLAQEQGSSEVVRDFGKRMVADYTRANEQLAAGAKQAAYPKPVLLRPHQKVFERFNFMSKSDFDKKYMAEMVGQHDEAVRLFEQEAKHARVQSLKQLAASLLPDVQQDQSVAIQAAGSVGADVTATASREQ